MMLAADPEEDLATDSTVGSIGSPRGASDGDLASVGTPSPPKVAEVPALLVSVFSAELMSSSRSSDVETSALRLAARLASNIL